MAAFTSANLAGLEAWIGHVAVAPAALGDGARQGTENER